MSNDASDLQSLPLPEETQATQASLDNLNAFLNAPVTKLDEDEYKVSDIDGVTESVLGSGNMNFLMMQAGQTNESIDNANPFEIEGSNATMGPSAFMGGLTTGSQASDTRNGFDTAMDRASATPDAQGGRHDNGQFTNNTGSLGASNAAANSTSASPLSTHDSVSNAASYSSSSSSSTSQTATNGNNGTNGTNGSNGGDGGGNTTNITNNYETTTVNNTTNYGDTNVTLIDENFLETVQNIVNNTTNNSSDFLSTVVNNVSNIVNNVINNNEGGDGLGPVGISLDATLNDLTNATLDVISGDTITNVLNETINLSPATGPLSDLTGNILAHGAVDVILNPFQYDHSPNDHDLHIGTDLNLLGQPLPNVVLGVPLDVVEGLLGDIDIDVGLDDDLLDLPLLSNGPDNGDTDLSVGGLEPITNALETVTNPVEDLAGDIDVAGDLHLGLIGLGNDQTGPDTDVTIPVDVNLLGTNLLNETIAVNLDPLESITGDIDLDLTAATNLLGNTADPLIDNHSGGADTPILSDLGNMLSGLGNTILPAQGQNGDTDLSLGTGNGALSNSTALFLDSVEDITGDIDLASDAHIALLGIGQDAGGPDTDLTIPVDVNLLSSDLLNQTISVNLDPVESLTGDIDLDLTAATNILGNTADGLVDNAQGGDSAPVPNFVGDTLSGIGNDLLPAHDGNGDTDLSLGSVLGLHDGAIADSATNLFLDPVEDLAGDIDLAGTLDAGLLGVTGGDAAGSDALFDIAFVDAPITTDDATGVSLDSTESWLVDAGANIGASIGLLNDTAPGLVDNHSGGGDTTILSPLGNGLHDIASDAVSGLSDHNDPIADINTLLADTTGTLNATISDAVSMINDAPSHTSGLDLGALVASTDAGSTVSSITSWTESAVPDAGNLLGHGLGDIASSLADPVAAPSVITLPAVPALPPIPAAHGLLGGNSHHGGLFG